MNTTKPSHRCQGTAAMSVNEAALPMNNTDNINDPLLYTSVVNSSLSDDTDPIVSTSITVNDNDNATPRQPRVNGRLIARYGTAKHWLTGEETLKKAQYDVNALTPFLSQTAWKQLIQTVNINLKWNQQLRRRVKRRGFIVLFIIALWFALFVVFFTLDATNVLPHSIRYYLFPALVLMMIITVLYVRYNVFTAVHVRASVRRAQAAINDSVLEYASSARNGFRPVLIILTGKPSNTTLSICEPINNLPIDKDTIVYDIMKYVGMKPDEEIAEPNTAVVCCLLCLHACSREDYLVNLKAASEPNDDSQVVNPSAYGQLLARYTAKRRWCRDEEFLGAVEYDSDKLRPFISQHELNTLIETINQSLQWSQKARSIIERRFNTVMSLLAVWLLLLIIFMTLDATNVLYHSTTYYLPEAMGILILFIPMLLYMQSQGLIQQRAGLRRVQYAIADSVHHYALSERAGLRPCIIQLALSPLGSQLTLWEPILNNEPPPPPSETVVHNVMTLVDKKPDEEFSVPSASEQCCHLFIKFWWTITFLSIFTFIVLIL